MSSRIHTYGELMEVFFGKIGHYAISIAQITQILFIVGEWRKTWILRISMRQGAKRSARLQ